MIGQNNFKDVSKLRSQLDKSVSKLELSKTEQITSEVMPADIQHNTMLEII